jgi:hypothetical protein
MQKRLVWVCLLAVSAAFVVTSSEASNRPATGEVTRTGAVATPGCLRANLTLRFIDTDAAMGGVRSSGYAFKNNGTSACSLIGFPTLQLLNKAGNPMGTKKIQTPKGAAVELSAGGEAFFSVDFNQGGAGHEGPPCPASTKVKIPRRERPRPLCARTPSRFAAMLRSRRWFHRTV